jgi:hypothetical protein
MTDAGIPAMALFKLSSFWVMPPVSMICPQCSANFLAHNEPIALFGPKNVTVHFFKSSLFN